MLDQLRNVWLPWAAVYGGNLLVALALFAERLTWPGVLQIAAKVLLLLVSLQYTAQLARAARPPHWETLLPRRLLPRARRRPALVLVTRNEA